ncbi:protein STPG4 isoform X1 [Oreochromis niloticus]|uniref:protein STPG4 isoform X1 n=1 Tax=Oreochromis niloticus TaxID=8128 RepID=UPI000393E925|nr:protein STPG4 isoform X1 [Oreochromis niloticus]XP_025753350.1 protein STPG4 isoform X1 [Oreochromis niloticus]XP_025753351.1 protein STPG4 isoform X1 [Oreochromis niloticus]XP_025753352.1 protein STPG4 isoform X1 [Oreochromis niloticus]XP_025753353.1 protein STPG4 isoform X1 [Oreochromis niloticus]
MSWSGHRTDKGDDTVELCGRGSWWLGTLRDTPIPGTYHVRDFVEEADLNPVKKTYGFKGVGRKTQMLGVRKGDLLLPGAYEYTDSTQEVLMHQASYSFKNCPRPDIFTLGIRDKHINTSPCDYNVTATPVEKIPCKHVMFRSTVQRISFLPMALLHATTTHRPNQLKPSLPVSNPRCHGYTVCTQTLQDRGPTILSGSRLHKDVKEPS